MASAADRVETYIIELTTRQRGLDKDIVHTMNDVELRTEDLRELVAKARAWDGRKPVDGCSDCRDGSCRR